MSITTDEVTAAVSQPRVALVTGPAGFAGKHLVDALLRETAWSIVGFGRRPPDEHDPRFRHIVGDLLSTEQVAQAVIEAQPDFVFHLAAATPPALPATLFATNLGGTTNLLEAIMTSAPRARVLVVGSDAQYGVLPARYVPTPERAPMHPVNPYGRSKLLQERIAQAYWRMNGLQVICVRPFNHIGPGQSDRFVVASLARQIARAEAGLGPNTIQVGRTDTARDFTDVRDTVRAYLACIQRGRAGAVYNVGSGEARRIADIATLLSAGTRAQMIFDSDPARVRPGDVLVTQCDASRLRARTGWAPCVPIETTLADTLEYWRTRVRDELGSRSDGDPATLAGAAASPHRQGER